MAIPAATVVITTKNRKDDLRVAVRSALGQDTPVEVLVIDDGSTDGTSAMIRAEFPAARLHREEVSGGLIVRRNQGARLASAPIVFSIDDDAAFSTPRVVSQTLADFDHPRIGAVAIPFIDVRKDAGLVRQRPPDRAGRFVTDSYIGTAHALRRDVFLQLGGYREHLFHQGEEPDYCVRMLDAGCVVRLGRADVIHHFESPRRSFERMDYYGRRNDVLFAWHNVPLPDLLAHLPATTVNGAAFGFRIGRPWRMLYGLAGGYASMLKFAGKRRAVSRRAYRLYRELKRRGAVGFEEVEARLPAIGGPM